MRITFLGTGSADGWPNAFCACGSCEVERGAGRSRRPASALVDDVILIDCGPAATHASSASGRSLRDVEHVLITHGHPDHLDPAFLLARHWTSATRMLTIWAPANAVELCRDWIAPGDPVRLNVVTPGDRVTLTTARGDYQALVLPAAHSSGNGDVLAEEAVLLELTAPDGQRLLYATDTGPLPDDTIAMLTEDLDVLVLDETFGLHATHDTGHHDLVTFTETVATLRRSGAVTESTTVLATHLSHHNPPTPALRARLRSTGVHLPEDLDVIDSRANSTPAARRLFVLGGARSGKSSHAEHVAAQWSDSVTYVATGGVRADDAEWAARVEAHQDRRPTTWATIESFDIAGILESAEPSTVVLIDCLTLWLTSRLDARDAWERAERGEAATVTEEIMSDTADLARAIRSAAVDVVLVSNEVGWGVVPGTASGRLFRDLMGRVNSSIADACDESVLVVAGRGIALRELAVR